jgi:hypothetical protein
MMNTNMLLQVLLILLAVATFLGSTECKVIITEVGANSDINVRRRRFFIILHVVSILACPHSFLTVSSVLYIRSRSGGVFSI